MSCWPTPDRPYPSAVAMRRAWYHEGYNLHVNRLFLEWLDAGEPDLRTAAGQKFIYHRPKRSAK